MRTALTICVLLGVTVIPARAQGIAGRDGFPYILDTTARRSVFRSVLRERKELLRGEPIIDGCSLSLAMGDTTAGQAALSAFVGDSVRGSLHDGCLTEDTIRRDHLSELVFFRNLRFETDEFVPSLAGIVPRQSGLVVVKLIVRERSKSRTRVEEWVMREARSGVWAVETIRFFGYTYT